ncbi:MAG: hypothetical protein KI786_06265 [Mameliella sp.]|nr:hypothetical protein [Phaeodactylibacter sp.]
MLKFTYCYIILLISLLLTGGIMAQQSSKQLLAKLINQTITLDGRLDDASN